MASATASKSKRTLNNKTLHFNDYEKQREVEVANHYLRDDHGNLLELTDEQFEAIRKSYVTEGEVAKMELAELDQANMYEITPGTRASTYGASQEVAAVAHLVRDCYEDTIRQLNQLQHSIAAVSENVKALGTNVGTVANALYALQSEFNRYVEKDAKASSLHLAETRLIQLNQRLEKEFGHNDELRRTAVGMLQASDIAAIRTETILTQAEELCIKTPRYWLAPALVVLARWIHASQDETEESRQSLSNALNDAFFRDREKTALFFGLICRRANHISQANEWFKEYISFQNPREVDHTCIVLLNAYAAGVMGQGEEERSILRTMSGWLNTLIADPEGIYERKLINDWKAKCRELYEVSNTQTVNSYPALREFSPALWPQLQASMSATCLHREMGIYLTQEMNRRDFKEDPNVIIDNMISDLVTSYDADELPIKREQQYQQLIVDLNGNEQTASVLRQIKDDILSETKSFTEILSDAVRGSHLSSANAATRRFAIKLLMPWIKKAYDECVGENRSTTPREIPLQMDDFSASTTDGSNEESVAQSYVAHVNRQENEATAASNKKAASAKNMLYAGAGIAAAGLVLTIVFFAMGSALGILALVALIGGGILAGYGYWLRGKCAKELVEICDAMQVKRTNGLAVIHEFMREVREWRKEFSAHESLLGGVTVQMESIIEESRSMDFGFAE